MKKIFFVFILFLFIHQVSGVSLQLENNYQPLENILGEIIGPVLEPIIASDVELRRNNVLVAFEYDLKKIGDRYFIYGIAPLSPNNYTLLIKNVLTIQNNQRQIVDIEKNFSVSGSQAQYSIRPGFIITSSDFEVIVTSNIDHTQTISLSHRNQTISLNPGENKIRFYISDFTNGFNMINIGKYKFPSFIIKPRPITNISQKSQSKIILIEPDKIIKNFIIGKEQEIKFKIINIGENEIRRFVFEYDSDKYNLNPKKIDKLRANESINVSLIIKKKNENLTDTILIIFGNETIELPVIINYITNITSNLSSHTDITRNITSRGYYCQELRGEICSFSIGEKCSGDVVESLDGRCCIGRCFIEKEKDYSWIGYLISLIVLIGIIFVGIRYYRTKKLGRNK